MSKTLIMIPVYNAEAVLSRSVQSALNQTAESEVWVVDNLSTDRTREAVKEIQKRHRNLKLYVNDKNYGRVGNWNKCLDLFERSKYKYLKFLFSGDELLAECVKEVEKVFELDDEIAAVATAWEFRNLDATIDVIREHRGNHLYGRKKMKLINLEEGGLLGTIVCNTYNKKYIGGYRFNEMFISKSDFDFKIFSGAKGYYLDKVLARFNLDSRRTYHKAKDYLTETEFVFNRAYWLEKMKPSFTKGEYDRIREKLYIEFVTRSMEYYSLNTLQRLCKAIINKIPGKIYIKMGEFRQKYLWK